MKKFLISILILIMCLGFSGCRNDGETADVQQDAGQATSDVQNGEAAEDTQGQDQTKDEEVQESQGVTILKTTDIQGGEYCDLGLKVDTEYVASETMERIDEDNISGYTDEFEKRLKELTETAGGSWDVMCDYDDDPDFGKMLMADAIKGGDPEDAYLQLGCYEDEESNGYVYYVGYCSANMTAFDQGIEQTVKEIKNLFGVTVDPEKLKGASKDAFEKVKENQDYFLYEQDAVINAENYAETVCVTMEVGYPEEGDEIIGYVYCERAKVYN